MHITILAHGSRGDVQPYLALGIGLRQAGYEVRLAAPRCFQEFVVEHGLDFAPLAGDPAQLAQALADRAGRNPLRAGQVIAEYTLPLAAQVLNDVRVACQGTDAVIHSFLTTIAGHQIARELDIPDFSALLFPAFARTAAFPNPALPALPLGGWYNRLTHDFFTQSFWQFSRLGYNWAVRRRHPHLPRLPGWPFSSAKQPATPILYGFSEYVIPRPPEWSENIHITGYWFLDPSSAWQPPAELVDFLATGPPPVYIGFGSMITHETEKLLESTLEALAQTGQRGLLLSGWSGLGRVNLPAHVSQIESAPHHWLFPRMATIVHHGGAGTTAAALRSGVPAIITPFTADQPFWGRRVYQLGVGPRPIPRQRLTAEKLARAIELALNDQVMRQRAATLGQRIRAEDGIERAVEIIKHYLVPKNG
jgi:UDP:flavonoid glycosyltransferase YjiC (YdhE family)